jgi:hypothetical protein
MDAVLIRYWFEFDVEQSLDAKMKPWVGVTAWTLDDAQNLARDRLFSGHELPPLTRVIENVDVDSLDEKHVRRHMLAPNERGIWYPMGYQNE